MNLEFNRPSDSPPIHRSSRSSTNEMRRIDLDLVAVLRAHLIESDLGLVEMMRILNGSEADRDSGGVAVVRRVKRREMDQSARRTGKEEKEREQRDEMGERT